jgi:hypothetical protein
MNKFGRGLASIRGGLTVRTRCIIQVPMSAGDNPTNASHAAAPEQLGSASFPSGIAMLIDCGTLNFWSHDRTPWMEEWHASPDTVAAANSAEDYEISGPDADAAADAIKKCTLPRHILDIPQFGKARLLSEFQSIIESNGFRAELQSVGRIPHLERARMVLRHDASGGEVFYNGMTAIVCAGIPQDLIPVLGLRRNAPDYSDRWDQVWLQCRFGETVTQTRLLGCASVDWARLMFCDLEALGEWQHEESLDGKADFVFWGVDSEKAAVARGASRLSDTEWGWLDLPVEEILDLGQPVDDLCQENGWRVKTDFRPHSHHHVVMNGIREEPTESGVVEVAGTQMCAFSTTWGDGFYPVYLDSNAQGEIVAVRVHLGNPDILDRQRRMMERLKSK